MVRYARARAEAPTPADLKGRRCLDIGTYDGFWAFEMERRGGEVTAIDILDDTRWDWPANASDAHREAIEQRKGRGDGFLIARRVLGSSVERLDCSIYDLDPFAMAHFDFVYLGSLLSTPARSRARTRAGARDQRGQLLIVDAIALGLTLLGPRSPGRPSTGRPAGLVQAESTRARAHGASGGMERAFAAPDPHARGAGFHHPGGLWPYVQCPRPRGPVRLRGWVTRTQRCSSSRWSSDVQGSAEPPDGLALAESAGIHRVPVPTPFLVGPATVT